jgi:hypothetical protein
MELRRALLIAACLLPAVSAAAQAPWPGQPETAAPAAAPWPGQPQQPAQAGPSAWSQPQQPVQQALSPWSQPPQNEPPCVKEFAKLREDAQKKAGAIQQASKHRPPPNVACNLFNNFYAAEAKLIKYASANATACGIPKEAVDSMKQQHARTNDIRTNVCHAAAAGPPRPAAPSLSDALSAPIPDSDNIKTGRGTFDTLTGSPLGK